MLGAELIYQGILVFICSVLLTLAIRAAAIRYKLFDKTDDRKVHTVPVPRVGGIAIFLSFMASVLLFADLDRPAIALVIASTILFLMGVVDDFKSLNPFVKLSFQIIASLVVLAGGIGIVNISLPFLSEAIHLDLWQIPMEINGFQFTIIPIANIFTIFWIVLIINAVNLLDGLDGLASGVATVAFLTLLAMAGQGFGVFILSFCRLPIFGLRCYFWFFFYNFLQLIYFDDRRFGICKNCYCIRHY